MTVVPEWLSDTLSLPDSCYWICYWNPAETGGFPPAPLDGRPTEQDWSGWSRLRRRACPHSLSVTLICGWRF